MDQKTIVIFGGAGFVGAAIVKALAGDDWTIRLASRTPRAISGTSALVADISDASAVRRAVANADVVVNCVGILEEIGANGFAAVQGAGAEHVARAAAEAGARLVHVSAIGANSESTSEYARSKAQGEAAVRRHVPEAVILRPSIIFGPGDSFFNRFKSMTNYSPTLPLVGGDTRFQPVFVGDVADAVVKAAKGEVEAGSYELGGPDIETFKQLMARLLGQIGRRRIVIDLPFSIGRIMGGTFDFAHRITGGLAPRPLTRDQVANLATDNVVAEDARGFSDLGIAPKSMDEILPTYLN